MPLAYSQKYIYNCYLLDIYNTLKYFDLILRVAKGIK